MEYITPNQRSSEIYAEQMFVAKKCLLRLYKKVSVGVPHAVLSETKDAIIIKKSDCTLVITIPVSFNNKALCLSHFEDSPDLKMSWTIITGEKGSKVCSSSTPIIIPVSVEKIVSWVEF